MEIFSRKFKFTQAQFAELLSETTQAVVLVWTSGTPIDSMIEDVLHAAAEQMPHFTEDHWKVADFIHSRGGQPITLPLTKEDLSQCGPEFQTAIMDSTLLPPEGNLVLRLSSFPSDLPYLNISATLLTLRIA